MRLSRTSTWSPGKPTRRLMKLVEGSTGQRNTTTSPRWGSPTSRILRLITGRRSPEGDLLPMLKSPATTVGNSQSEGIRKGLEKNETRDKNTRHTREEDQAVP